MPDDRTEPYKVFQEEALRSLVRHIEKALDQIQENAVQNEGRLSKIETSLELLTEQSNRTIESINKIKSGNVETTADISELKTQMNIIRWWSCALGVAIIGVIVETMYFLFKSI